VAVLCGLLFAAVASSGPIYNNLSNGSGTGGDINSNTWYADAFSTDSNTYALQNVTLELKGDSTSGTFSIWLYSSTSNAPGSPLMTLGNSLSDSSISSSGFAPYSYAGGGYALAANTMYWIVVGGTSLPGFDVAWEGSLSSTITSVGPGATASSSNGGSSWFAHALNSDYKPNLMEVDSGGAAIPEPGSLLLTLAAAVLFGFRSKVR